MVKFLILFAPMIGALLMDFILVKIYGHPSLSLLLAKCYKSKYFKWLAWNVWGNDDWYFEQIISHNKPLDSDG